MSHSHAKRKRRNYTWCAVLFALVGTACMLFGIIRLLWPEITEPRGSAGSQPALFRACIRARKKYVYRQYRERGNHPR